ncbi:MAG: SDR family oxidoreductase, partial [Acetobacteraceae bacterium]|nr:SDR family oxidoreductase [Acetobacteraceae bacterium]
AGARVTVLGRQEAPLLAAVRDGAAHAFVAADVSATLPPLPRCDILVHAAGAAESAPFLRGDEALWQRMLAANLLGAVAVMRAVLPAMLEAREGRIIAIASTAAVKGYPYVTAYTAAKHGLLGLVRALAVEVAGRGVTVNALCPGFTDTAIVADSVARIAAKTGRTEAEALVELTRHNPQGRLVRPEEVAAAALFLCLPEAAAINGAAIPVAGGEA